MAGIWRLVVSSCQEVGLGDGGDVPRATPWCLAYWKAPAPLWLQLKVPLDFWGEHQSNNRPRPGLHPWRSRSHGKLKGEHGARARLSRSEWEVKAGWQSCDSLAETVGCTSSPSPSSTRWLCSCSCPISHLCQLTPLLFPPILFFQYLHFIPSRMYLGFLIKAP